MAIPENIRDWIVLIVDDEPDNIGVASKVLEHYGATVHIAQDGREGLLKLETVRPTFILLDLSMPQMDGWEMHSRLKANSLVADIPVIAVTAHVMEGDKENVLKHGFDGYIPKPFRIANFLGAIREILARMSARQTPAPQPEETAVQPVPDQAPVSVISAQPLPVTLLAVSARSEQS